MLKWNVLLFWEGWAVVNIIYLFILDQEKVYMDIQNLAILLAYCEDPTYPEHRYRKNSLSVCHYYLELAW